MLTATSNRRAGLHIRGVVQSGAVALVTLSHTDVWRLDRDFSPDLKLGQPLVWTVGWIETHALYRLRRIVRYPGIAS